MTITSGRKPTTAPTPPMIPSTSRADNNGLAFASISPAHAWKVSIHATSVSAISGPTQTCEISNTRYITAAKIGIPSSLLVSTASILSPVP